MSRRVSYELLSEQLGAPLPDDRETRRRLYALTARAIKERLPDRQQAVIRLCVLEGVSASTVSRERKRALATLLNALEYAMELLR